MPLCQISPEQCAFKRVDGKGRRDSPKPFGRIVGKSKMWSALPQCRLHLDHGEPGTNPPGPWKANRRLTPCGEVIHFVVLAAAGSLILLVNAFSSDQTQGSSSISSCGRSFKVTWRPSMGLV